MKTFCQCWQRFNRTPFNDK